MEPDLNDIVIQPQDYHKCDICGKTFSCKSSLNKHIRHIHKCQTFEPEEINCGLCPKSCQTIGKLHDHIETEHEVNIECEYFTFESEKDFMNWKGQVESSSLSRFVAHGGRNVTDGVVKRIYYCHRSGSTRSNVRSGCRKRGPKIKGSNKLGFHCPARVSYIMHVDDCVEVEYTSTHVGHDLEVQRVTLTKSTRDDIANKIKEKVSVDTILDDAKEVRDGTVKRENFLTRKDVKNILREYKIPKDGVVQLNSKRRNKTGKAPRKRNKEPIKGGPQPSQDLASLPETGLLAEGRTEGRTEFVLSTTNPAGELEEVPLQGHLVCSECKTFVDSNLTCSCVDSVANGIPHERVYLVCRTETIPTDCEPAVVATSEETLGEFFNTTTIEMPPDLDVDNWQTEVEQKSAKPLDVRKKELLQEMELIVTRATETQISEIEERVNEWRELVQQ